MWGNRLGWSISGIIVCIFVVSMLVLQHVLTGSSPMSSAFANDSGNLQQLSLPIDPRSMVPAGDSCDAADFYTQALLAYDKAPELYKAFNPANLNQLDACTPIIAATHCQSADLFALHPDQVVNFGREKAPIVALQHIGEALAKRAQYELVRGDPTTATKDAQAVFSLGANLFDERIVYEELSAGLALMGQSDVTLLKIAEKAGNAPLANRLSSFEQARKEFVAHGGRLYQLHLITKNVDGDLSAQHAGDVFALAEKSHERLWRVEACFQLGRMKFNIGENGNAADQRNAAVLLHKLAASDHDPIVKLAATKAIELTPEDYQRE